MSQRQYQMPKSSSKTPKQATSHRTLAKTSKSYTKPHTAKRLRKFDRKLDRTSQTLSDLLTYRLFPSKHRSPAELVNLHTETISTLCATVPTHPLSPQSLSLFSLQQLHTANHQLKTLALVLEQANDSIHPRGGIFSSQPPPSLPSKYSPTSISPYIVTNRHGSISVHIPPNTKLISASSSSIYPATFALNDLSQLFDTLVTHTIPASLLPLIDVIDEQYFESHLNSVMQFTSPYSSLILESKEYKSLFSPKQSLTLPAPTPPNLKAPQKQQPSSSVFSRTPIKDPIKPPLPPSSQSSFTLLPFLHSLHHSSQVSKHATQPSPIWSHWKETSAPTPSLTTRDDIYPPRPSVEIVMTEQSASSPSVASFTASYSVVKPHTRSSHTKRNKPGLFDSSFLSNISPFKFSIPTIPSLLSSFKSALKAKNKAKSKNKAKPSSSSQTIPPSSELASMLQAKASKLNQRNAKNKPRSTQMSRERQGFVEFAFLPPIFAPHHTTLSANYLAKHTNFINRSQSTSSTALRSPSKDIDPINLAYSEQTNDDDYPARKNDNESFFTNYPSRSTFRLTFERRSIRSLFAHRPILSPIQLASINTIFDQLIPPPQLGQSSPSTPLTYSSLLLAFSERKRCISPSKALNDITLLDCPTLLVHFNALLSVILESIPCHLVKEVEHSLTHGPALCTTTSTEKLILNNAFKYTFDHFAHAETPRNRQRNIDHQELQQRFINAIYIQDPPSSTTSITTANKNEKKELLYHVQGLPLVSGLQGIVSILQHELLHGAIFIHAPQLWTTTTDRSTNLPSPMKTTQNQREVLDLVQHRYEHAFDHLPHNPYPPFLQFQPSSSSVSSSTSHSLHWNGNILPSLLKTKTPNFFWPRQSTDETPYTWKSNSLSKISNISNLSLADDDDDDSPSRSPRRIYKTNISSHQDGHSFAFRVLARNLFGHNKINVSLDSHSTFLQR